MDSATRLQGPIVAVAVAPDPIDPGVHLAIYISDPDGNDLELAWDRPFADWPRDEQGHVAMTMDSTLDLEALLAHAPAR